MIARSSSHSTIEVLPEPGLIEVDLGSWTDPSPDELRRANPVAFGAYLRYPTAASFPDGERMSGAERRAFDALARIADPVDGRAVVAVTHELVIRLVLLRLRRLEATAMWDPHVGPGTAVVTSAHVGSVLDSCLPSEEAS